MDYITQEEMKRIREEIAKVRTPETLVEGKWNISPLNRNPKVLSKFGPPQYPHSVVIRDNTLRTVEQTPGVCLSDSERRRLAAALVEAGLQSIHTALLYQPTKRLQRGDSRELLSLTSDAASKEVQFIKSLDSSIEVIVGGSSEEEVDAVADSGADMVQMFFPCMPVLNLVYGIYGRRIQRAAWRGEDWRKTIHPPLTDEAQITRIQELSTYAKAKGLKVQLATPQLYHTSPEYFDKMCKGASDVGVDEIGLGDGSSAFGHEAYAYLVSRAIEMAPGVRICLSRPHNGFGNAMAKALAGIHAGAEVLEGSINSLCTGAGQVDITEAVAALEVLYGVKTGIKMERLTSLRRLVEDITQVFMAQNKAVTGEHAWTYTEEANTEEDELGLYLHKCVNPTLFGNVGRLEVGRYSGTWTMLGKLKDIGVSVDKDLVPIILDEVKQEIEIRKRVLAVDEIKEIAERVKAGSG